MPPHGTAAGIPPCHGVDSRGQGAEGRAGPRYDASLEKRREAKAANMADLHTKNVFAQVGAGFLRILAPIKVRSTRLPLATSSKERRLCSSSSGALCAAAWVCGGRRV